MSRARRWVVTTHTTGRPRQVEVRLYTDLNHLRGAATRYTEHHASPIDFSNAAGTCHGFVRERPGKNGEWTQHPLCAIIRLAADHLTPLIVAHEVAHAAQHIYGLDYDDGEPITEHMHSGNEDFAYLYGELFNAVHGIFWTDQ